MPIRLQEKLRESRESIVGLSNIIEIIACSNAEVEPYYECMSCGTKGEANGMYNHLVGRQHRQEFLEKKFPNDPRYLLDIFIVKRNWNKILCFKTINVLNWNTAITGIWT